MGFEEDGAETGGIQCFDPAAPVLKKWTRYTVQNGLGDNSVYALACDRQGRIWAGHLNHGVSVFNNNPSGHWQNYEVVAGLSRPDTLSGPLGERIFDIAVSPKDGDVWMSSSAGLARYSDLKNDWTYYTRAVGLPSDQVQALAFDSEGNLYAGTQCDGLAIAQAADDFKYWRQVTGPDETPTVPQGEGLPTSLINDVLVTNEGILYVATTQGLAQSRDKGNTFRYWRGADWAEKAQGLQNRPQQEWKDSGRALLAEDYVTCLAEAQNNSLWVGYRRRGYALIDVARGYTKQVGSSSSYVTSLLATEGMPVVGIYGADRFKKPGQLERIATSFSQASFPSGALPPNANGLGTMVERIASVPSNSFGVAYLGEDWATQGDWVGRYGRSYNVLCGAMSPFDHRLTWDPETRITAAIDPQFEQRGDCLRAWIHWLDTRDRRCLYNPVAGVRRQAEWDDHGEVYPMSIKGPNIRVNVKVPAGLHRLSFYFINKDGHARNESCRDYVLKVKNTYKGTVDGYVRARVRDFWNGSYKSFIVSGPSVVQCEIDRNFSFNTIVSGVFLDRLTGNRTAYEEMPIAWLGDEDVREPLPLAVGAAVEQEWVSSPAAWLKARQLSLVERLRHSMDTASAQVSDRDQLRWQLRLWTNKDRKSLYDILNRAWDKQLRISPSLKWQPQRTALN